MLKLRPTEFADFEHYLQVRESLASPKAPEGPMRTAIAMGGAVFVAMNLMQINPAIGLAAVGAGGAVTALVLTRKRKAPTPENEILKAGDKAAKELLELSKTRRLWGSLHPGMATLLNECAGYWRKITAINQQGFWKDAAVASVWAPSRDEWTQAADLAMAEALVLGQSSLTLQGPRSRAEEVIGDVIDTFVKVPRPNVTEPLPLQFRELRQLTDRFQLLAQEVERIAQSAQSQPIRDRSETAAGQLEDVLGRMRAIREAEHELRQNA